MIDLLLQEGELVGVQGRRIHRDQEDRVVNRDLVADRLNEPEDRDEIVVRHEVFDRVQEDDPSLAGEELLDGEGELLEVLRPNGVLLLPHVAQP